MKQSVLALASEIDSTCNSITAAILGLGDELDSIETELGNASANKRISNTLMNQSSKLKVLSKKIFAIRNMIIEHGKEKHALRVSRMDPNKPKPLTPTQRKALKDAAAAKETGTTTPAPAAAKKAANLPK